MKQSNYAKVFKALSNPQRLKIFTMIHERSKVERKGAVIPVDAGECCHVAKAFTWVCECMKLSRSTISHHFKELQNAGLIVCEREGQTMRCRVNEETLRAVQDFLK